MSRTAPDSPKLVTEGVALPLGLGMAVFVGIVLGYRAIGFSVLQSDVLGYVNWSHNLAGQTFPSHMPGYPGLIALGRLLTLHLVGDVILAQAICLLFWGAGISLASRILGHWAPEVKEIGTLSYAVAPFVGVFYTAYPVADIPAHTVFLGAVWAAMQARWWMCTFITAFGLMIHQALYPFYFLLALVCLWRRGMKWYHFLASGVPFAMYYVWMAVSRGNMNWILAYHENTTLRPRKGFPLFDGILGNLLGGSPVAFIKGSILLGILICAVLLAIYFLRGRNWLPLALLIPLFIYAVISNETISFLPIRLVKIMVLPACLWAREHPAIVRTLRDHATYWALALCLVISQFVWAAYTVRYLSK